MAGIYYASPTILRALLLVGLNIGSWLLCAGRVRYMKNKKKDLQYFPNVTRAEARVKCVLLGCAQKL